VPILMSLVFEIVRNEKDTVEPKKINHSKKL